MKKHYFLFLFFSFISFLSFGQVIITEIADPNNNSKARFVEIYNAGSTNVDLTGWYLLRWTNNNTTPQGSNISLTPIGTLNSGAFAIIAANATEFQSVYGMAADINAGTGGAADSNGDDQIAIYNNTDTLVDIFGVPGEDGSGTCHEFEDGRAERKATVKTAKTVWSEADWNVWADSSVSGCTSHVNTPQEAPSAFDPKSWIGTSSTPLLSISSPSNNATLAPGTTSVDVAISVTNFNVASGGTGDGYIKYTLDSGSAVDKFDTNNIMLTGLAAGGHTVTVELVNNSGNSLSPAVSASVNFSIATFTQVANLAALRAGNQGGYYELTGEAILTYARTSRNQKYIQDTTGGILIDDNAGTITTTYNVYDGITGLKGRLGAFGGVLQFVPSENPGTASSTGNTVTPEVVTLADFEANAKNYESELIKIENVVFTNAGDNFVASRNYEITSGGTTSNFRTNFSEADYIGTVIPSGSVNMTVIGASFTSRGTTTNQVVAINLSGFVLSVAENNIEGFAVYPNPTNNKTFSITSASVETKNIEIFNILGKKVYETSVSGTNNRIEMDNISSGLYILKVVEADKIATQRLIVK